VPRLPDETITNHLYDGQAKSMMIMLPKQTKQVIDVTENWDQAIQPPFMPGKYELHTLMKQNTAHTQNRVRIATHHGVPMPFPQTPTPNPNVAPVTASTSTEIRTCPP